MHMVLRVKNHLRGVCPHKGSMATSYSDCVRNISTFAPLERLCAGSDTPRTQKGFVNMRVQCLLMYIGKINQPSNTGYY